MSDGLSCAALMCRYLQSYGQLENVTIYNHLAFSCL